MKLITVMHNNFELSSHIHDLASRAQPYTGKSHLEDMLADDWMPENNNHYVHALKNLLIKVEHGLVDLPTITDNDLESMFKIIDDYHKSQTGLSVTIEDFFKDHPQLMSRYTNSFADDEDLYDDAATFETVHMQSEIMVDDKMHVIRSSITFDDQDFLNHSATLLPEQRHSAYCAALEDGKFSWRIDISEKLENRLILLASFNQNSVVPPLEPALTQIMLTDESIMKSFSDNNAAFNDFSEKRMFVQNILKQCPNDNIFNDPTIESVMAFKSHIDEQHIEAQLAHAPSIDKVLEMMQKIRNDSFKKNNGPSNSM